MSGSWFLEMINYIPFLKYKSNEIIALGELQSPILSQITPFFDFPKAKDKQTSEQFKTSVDRLSRSIHKHIADIGEAYIDTYDVSDEFEVDGEHSYSYLVKSLGELNVIPVISIDRSESHLRAAHNLKINKDISTNVVAFRITPEDFQNYSVVEEDIGDTLGEIFKAFETIDLIFDCRYCSDLDAKIIAKNISNFSEKFSNNYTTRRLIVTGSSIPASIGDVLPVDSECFIEKKEIDIFNEVKACSRLNFLYGDYATVSPNYSDVNIKPEIMQNVITAKLIYSVGKQHFFIRGGSLKTKGYGQYFDLASVLCAKDFFRGAPYSSGDFYFEEKSKRKGNNCGPGTIVKPAINAHITYIVQDAPI